MELFIVLKTSEKEDAGMKKALMNVRTSHFVILRGNVYIFRRVHMLFRTAIKLLPLLSMRMDKSVIVHGILNVAWSAWACNN